MAYDIGAKIALEGEASFRQALRGVNSQLKALSSEMKSAMSEFDAADRSEQKLTKRNDVLQRSIRATGDKVEILTRQYNKQKSELDALEKALNKANSEFGENSKEAAKAQNAYNKQVEVVNRLATNLNDATAELNQMNRELSANEQELRNLSNSADDAGNGFGSLKAAVQKAMDDGKGKVSSMCDELAGQGGLVGAVGTACKSIPGIGIVMGAAAAVGISAMAKLAESVKDTAKNLVEIGDSNVQAMNHMRAATGANADEMERYEKAARTVYKKYAENMEEATEIVALTAQQIKGLSEKSLTKLSEDAYVLHDVFDYDFQDLVRASSTLIKQFGINGEEAYALIAQGAQNGLDYSGEMLDSLIEYSVHFKNAGISAEKMFDIFTAGVEAGAFNLDKIGDAVKELSIRAMDGSETTARGFKTIGLNADEMSEKFAKGGDAAKEAFDKTIQGLSNIEDPLKRNQAGVDLFGTMWEDLGADVIMQLDDIDGAYNKAADTMDQLNQIEYNDAEAAIKRLKKTIEEGMTDPIGEDLARAIRDVTNKFEEAFDDPEMQAAIGDIADAIGDLIEQLGDGAIDAIPEIADFLKSVAENAPAAVEGFQNVAGALKFVGDLTSSMSTGTFPQFAAQQIVSSETAQGAWSTFKDGVGGILGQLGESWEGFKENQSATNKRIGEDFGSLKDSVIAKAGELRTGAGEKFRSFRSDVSEAAKKAKEDAIRNFGGLKDGAVEKFTSLKAAAGKKFGEIKSQITKPISEAAAWVREKINGIRNFINGLRLKIPKIELPRMPKIRVTGKFSISANGVTVPKLEWYAKGGILTSPTIFGINGNRMMAGGEAGAEAVIPLSELWKQMEEKMSAFADKIIASMNEMYANTIDEERLARLIGQEIAKHSGSNNVTNNYFANGASGSKSRKELWRQKKRMGLV